MAGAFVVPGGAVTGVRVVSLKVDIPQSIPSDGSYHIVRFPYDGEPYDPHGMHQQLQPDGYEVRDWQRDDRSGLIWPTADGWGSLNALTYWEDADFTEYRSRFVRDPLGLAGEPDSTCTEDWSTTQGGEYRAKHWEIFVHPGVPLGFLVRHNASRPVAITLAEFKLTIHV